MAIRGRMYENVNISRRLQCLIICIPDSIGWSIFKAFSFHVNVQETEVQNMKFELSVLKWKKIHRNCHETLVHIMQPFLWKMSQNKASRSLPFICSLLNKNTSIHYRRFVQSWGLTTYTGETTLVLVQCIFFKTILQSIAYFSWESMLCKSKGNSKRKTSEIFESRERRTERHIKHCKTKTLLKMNPVIWNVPDKFYWTT